MSCHRQIALVLALADRQAEIGQRTEAVQALPALRREQRHDMVAFAHQRDTLAATLDHARTLVAKDRGGVTRWVHARGRVQVGVAYTASHEPDKDLAGTGLDSSTSRTTSGLANSSSTAARIFICQPVEVTVTFATAWRLVRPPVPALKPK